MSRCTNNDSLHEPRWGPCCCWECPQIGVSNRSRHSSHPATCRSMASSQIQSRIALEVQASVQASVLVWVPESVVQ